MRHDILQGEGMPKLEVRAIHVVSVATTAVVTLLIFLAVSRWMEPEERPMFLRSSVIQDHEGTEGPARLLQSLGYSGGNGHFGGDVHAPIEEHGFRLTAADPRLTFAVDVDTAAYAIVRRHLTEGRTPTRSSVRSRVSRRAVPPPGREGSASPTRSPPRTTSPAA